MSVFTSVPISTHIHMPRDMFKDIDMDTDMDTNTGTRNGTRDMNRDRAVQNCFLNAGPLVFSQFGVPDEKN
jgi:hypothetical protein